MEQARNKIARDSSAAIETLIDLADRANGESVRLGAARVVGRKIALARKPGLNWIELSEFTRYVDDLIRVSLDYVPTHLQGVWLQALSDSAGGRDSMQRSWSGRKQLLRLPSCSRSEVRS